MVLASRSARIQTTNHGSHSDFGSKHVGFDRTKAFARAVSRCDYANPSQILVDYGFATRGVRIVFRKCTDLCNDGARSDRTIFSQADIRGRRRTGIPRCSGSSQVSIRVRHRDSNQNGNGTNVRCNVSTVGQSQPCSGFVLRLADLRPLDSVPVHVFPRHVIIETPTKCTRITFSRDARISCNTIERRVYWFAFRIRPPQFTCKGIGVSFDGRGGARDIQLHCIPFYVWTTSRRVSVMSAIRREISSNTCV